MFQGGESFGENDTECILIGMHSEIQHYIYLITNLINSKVYVGQTKRPKNRRWQHWSEGRKPDSRNHLYRSMYEHGVENFRFEIIEECSMDNVNERERYWISHYRSCDPAVGYNKESGGNLGKSRILSEEEKIRIYQDPARTEAIRNALLGRKLSEEHKAAVSAGLTHYFETHEVKHTEESRRHMSEAQKIVGVRRSAACAIDPGHPDAQPKRCPHCDTAFYPKKMSPWGIKRHVAKKFCSKKCVMLHNNKNVSAETRSKIAATKTGTRLSDEQRRKISESMKAYRRNKPRKNNA
jgi:group I intron endonuclease